LGLARFAARADQPGAASVRVEAHAPPDEHENAVLEADQVPEVDEEPRHPREEATQLEPVDVCDGGGAADRGEVALVAVAEGPVRSVGEPGANDPRDLAALMHPHAPN